ncbi:MAG: hypothetical protein LBC09_01115, partial [Helicobacteraceae bacterium]|nr:hypothetical protein [Helicobacteraceae bacterium]
MGELTRMGEIVRSVEPYLKDGKRVYPTYIDGVRFRVVVGDVIKDGKTTGERVISFYSNRKAAKGSTIEASGKPAGPSAITVSTSSGKGESIAPSIPKDKSFTAKSPAQVGSSAAGFVAGGMSDEKGWNTERAIIGGIGGLAIGSRLAKRDMQKSYQGAVKIAKTFDDITTPMGKVKRLFANTLSDDYAAKREARTMGINQEAEKLEKLHKAIAGEYTEAERKALHEYLSGDSQTIPVHIKPLADHIRQTIDDLGSQLVNEGVLSKEAYQEWAGKYLHRNYEKHLGLKGAVNNLKTLP